MEKVGSINVFKVLGYDFFQAFISKHVYTDDLAGRHNIQPNDIHFLNSRLCPIS